MRVVANAPVCCRWLSVSLLCLVLGACGRTQPDHGGCVPTLAPGVFVWEAPPVKQLGNGARAGSRAVLVLAPDSSFVLTSLGPAPGIVPSVGTWATCTKGVLLLMGTHEVWDEPLLASAPRTDLALESAPLAPMGHAGSGVQRGVVVDVVNQDRIDMILGLVGPGKSSLVRAKPPYEPWIEAVLSSGVPKDRLGSVDSGLEGRWQVATATPRSQLADAIEHLFLGSDGSFTWQRKLPVDKDAVAPGGSWPGAWFRRGSNVYLRFGSPMPQPLVVFSVDGDLLRGTVADEELTGVEGEVEVVLERVE